MDIRERLDWLEGMDDIYWDVAHGRIELHALGLHLIRTYVWPLYEIAD